jgi:hypothetical protein
MVLVWTGVSYIPYGSVPKGIPRRLFSPNPWSPGAYDNWTVIKVCERILHVDFGCVGLHIYTGGRVVLPYLPRIQHEYE